MTPAFAVWITGLPGAGKSTLAGALSWELATRGVDAVVLQSDALRRVLTPEPRYDARERGIFYGTLSWFGQTLVAHGIPVIFDATANRRAYRERAREGIDRFVEVYVDTPRSTCERRDPKGLYEAARKGGAETLPGIGEPYEPPLHPDLVVHGAREASEAAARRIADLLEKKGYLKAPVEDPR